MRQMAARLARRVMVHIAMTAERDIDRMTVDEVMDLADRVEFAGISVVEALVALFGGSIDKAGCMLVLVVLANALKTVFRPVTDRVLDWMEEDMKDKG